MFQWKMKNFTWLINLRLAEKNSIINLLNEFCKQKLIICIRYLIFTYTHCGYKEFEMVSNLL